MTYNPSSANVTGPSGAIPIYATSGLTSDVNDFNYDYTNSKLFVKSLVVNGTGENFVIRGDLNQTSPLTDWQLNNGASVASITPSGKIDCIGRTSLIKLNTDTTTVTFDMNLTDYHRLTLGGNRTLAVKNDTDSQRFIVSLTQDASGSRTVTWWSGIRWNGGNTPTLVTTPNKEDIFTFIKYGSGDYRGMSTGTF